MASLPVFTLGQHGVDIVNSPIHTDDGSLVNCQNAQVSPDDAEISLKKRDGMVKVNSIALAGTVLAIISIPLPNP